MSSLNISAFIILSQMLTWGTLSAIPVCKGKNVQNKYWSISFIFFTRPCGKHKFYFAKITYRCSVGDGSGGGVFLLLLLLFALTFIINTFCWCVSEINNHLSKDESQAKNASSSWCQKREQCLFGKISHLTVSLKSSSYSSPEDW